MSQLDFSDLSIDDEILAEIGTWTSTRRLKLTVSNFIRNSKESNFMLKINDKRAQVQEKIMKQKARINKLMMTAPFWRMADKLGFVVGTFTIITFSYLLGKYPNDIFY